MGAPGPTGPWGRAHGPRAHGPMAPWAHESMGRAGTTLGSVPRETLKKNRTRKKRPWAQTSPGPKRALGPMGPGAQNGPWFQMGPGPKRALDPNGGGRARHLGKLITLEVGTLEGL